MPRSSRKSPYSQGACVRTPDGPGAVVAHELRKNTNGGPGTWQLRVRLDDQRIRHYSPNEVSPERKP